MKILLDTHSFLWFVYGDNKLSKKAIKTIENPENSLLLSIASIWELAIKISINKLRIKGSLKDFISEETSKNGIRLFGIKEDHIYLLTQLPYFNKDPFDRLLVCQCKEEEISIISADKRFDDYKINRIW
ncbi:MAG: type II toxin-antitoxin system VapC family toxin [bacterium]